MISTPIQPATSAMFHKTFPTVARPILAVSDKMTVTSNHQIAFDKMTSTATRQIFSMPNEIISAAIRPIFCLIRNFAPKLRFLAIAAVLAFPLLNIAAASTPKITVDGRLYTALLLNLVLVWLAAHGGACNQKKNTAWFGKTTKTALPT